MIYYLYYIIYTYILYNGFGNRPIFGLKATSKI